jgi:hypothetical protein
MTIIAGSKMEALSSKRLNGTHREQAGTPLR